MIRYQRICIYPKDVQRITGRSERYARKLLREIRLHLHKQDHQFVTIAEFCSYTGIAETLVHPLLVD